MADKSRFGIVNDILEKCAEVMAENEALRAQTWAMGTRDIRQSDDVKAACEALYAMSDKLLDENDRLKAARLSLTGAALCKNIR